MKPSNKFIFGALLVMACGAAAAADDTKDISGRYEGILSQLTSTTATLDSTKSFKFNPRNAKCFDHRGDAMTCETLVGIGYANRARLTVVDSVVTRIDVLAMQQ